MYFLFAYELVFINMYLNMYRYVYICACKTYFYDYVPYSWVSRSFTFHCTGGAGSFFPRYATIFKFIIQVGHFWINLWFCVPKNQSKKKNTKNTVALNYNPFQNTKYKHKSQKTHRYVVPKRNIACFSHPEKKLVVHHLPTWLKDLKTSWLGFLDVAAWPAATWWYSLGRHKELLFVGIPGRLSETHLQPIWEISPNDFLEVHSYLPWESLIVNMLKVVMALKIWCRCECTQNLGSFVETGMFTIESIVTIRYIDDVSFCMVQSMHGGTMI